LNFTNFAVMWTGDPVLYGCGARKSSRSKH